MFRSTYRALAGAALLLGALAAPAGAQTKAAEPAGGSAFQCDDGGKMFLTFVNTGSAISAKVWVRGAVYQLPNVPPEPGIARIVWSDGEHSLTWSPGVQLMWMDDDTHLMCGRGGHKH